LSDERPVLLVFGGSRGARSINRALTDHLEAYLEVCQVIHISGAPDAAWVQARRAELPPPLQHRYHPAPYLHEEMVAALLAADLVVSRAGASSLGEYPAAGLPAILAPYPYAGAHQALNAAYLARRGAALVVEDADLDRLLNETVLALITNKEKLQLMRQAAQRLAQPEAAARLAREILRVGTHGT
jgi:UDP-N-acetylglucosamine--N-acetylmuramyl-(pentapeptide) pyrophosphoryl-undecaprenol N-acetylglucosamine transferase